ncbi:MAG: hypothetical protein J5545_06675 [Bacteroidaceae bacterium]|nr:hypothetical protein [Bacteroidaceae bacterium]
MKKVSSLIVSVAVIGALFSCQGGQTSDLQSQVDSLNLRVERQAQDLDFYHECLAIISGGLDSIAQADSSLIRLSYNRENTITKESIQENLNAYANMLVRQRERLDELEGKLNENHQEVVQLRGLINHLNQQIAEKDAYIQELQGKLEQKDSNISLLLDEVNRLSQANAHLTNTVNAKEESLQVATAKLNAGYYIVGTSKELKEAGILTPRFLAKSKMDVDNIDVNLFHQIDIRNFKKIAVDDSKITIKSQHPSDSYRIESDKKNDTSTLYILDVKEFWSLTRFLIIQK